MVIQLVQQITLLFLLIGASSALAASLARPGCQDRCGNVIIPYPFGIGANCSADESLEISCNNSFTPPKPFITGINLEVLEISLSKSTVRVNNPVISSNCENRTNNQDVYLNGPFSFSDTNNRFTAMGCDNLALITRQGTVIGGCMSLCNVTTRDTTCYGLNCCQTTIPPFLKFINASFRSIDSNSDNKGCKYAFMVDQEWFTNLTDPFAVQEMEKVPAVLNWYTIGTCQTFGVYNSSVPNSSLCGTNASCSSTSNQSSSYRCQCDLGYEGNPYLPDGCQDINECAMSDTNRCEMICENTPGSYKCHCPPGYISVGYSCYKLKDNEGNRVRIIIIGMSSPPHLTDLYAVQKMEVVPAVLNWYAYGYCNSSGVYTFGKSLCSTNASYTSAPYQSTGSYPCRCDAGYE